MQAVQRETSLGWLALYALTAVMELPVILARYAAIYVLSAIALKMTGHSSGDAAEWAKLALLPALWSVAAFVNPGGSGWWWQQRLGGREPARDEYLAYRAALEELQANATIPLPAPKRWFVIDESAIDAAVCGDTLMLSRGLLESSHLTAVLAHELGHLQGLDARLALACKRLVIGGEQRPTAKLEKGQSTTSLQGVAVKRTLTRWVAHMMLALLRGGLALRVTSIGWGQVWCEAEYAADRFAALIGQGDELADFLQTHMLEHDYPISMARPTNHAHPPIKLRIDALRSLGKQQSHAPTQTTPTGQALDMVRLDTGQ